MLRLHAELFGDFGLDLADLAFGGFFCFDKGRHMHGFYGFGLVSRRQCR